MKKRYLTYAGIVAAAILIIIFAGILLTGSFSIFSSATIDPIPIHAAGDLVVITGTTNLDAGTRLELDILAVSSAPGTNPRVGGTDAFIVRGGGMSNTWSGALDTSAIPPGEYRVNACRVNDTSSRGDRLLATSRLRLTNTTSDPDKITRLGEIHKIDFIRINRPGTIYRGEKILISGTTNLPNDTGLLYLVIQQSNISVFTVDPKTRKEDLREGFTRSGLITAIPGEDGLNHWSFALDSTEFIPDQYEVIVTQDTVSTENIGKEGTFNTASLTVLEANADRFTTPVPVSGPCQAITIDALPGTMNNRSYTITGTTSLPAGSELLFQVIPTEFDLAVNRAGVTGSVSGATGTAGVVQGTGDTNTWSADLDLSTFPAREYLMNVSNDRMDPRTYDTIYGNAYCSKRFTLSG
ncbi:MAG: hypothetical protein LUQ71_07235 [Methanoregula sp.]|nr:hypothetical protein [Methanoregula sp.]